METVRFMYAYEHLPEDKKKLFFELLMYEEYIDEDVMGVALKTLGHKVSFYRIETKEVVKEAFKITNLVKFDALPMLSVNGKLSADMPDESFIEKCKEMTA